MSRIDLLDPTTNVVHRARHEGPQTWRDLEVVRLEDGSWLVGGESYPTTRAAREALIDLALADGREA